MKKHYFALLFFLVPFLSLMAQDKVEISSMFLENKDLGPVNFETKEFSKWGEKLSSLLESELKKENEAFEV
jgi:hypothetical protein